MSAMGRCKRRALPTVVATSRAGSALSAEAAAGLSNPLSGGDSWLVNRSSSSLVSRAMFSSFNSFTSSLGSLASQAQQQIKNVEHAVDQAMGIPVLPPPADANGAATTAAAGGERRALPPAAGPISAQQQGLDSAHQQQLANTSGDFFGNFLVNAAAAVAPTANATTAAPAAKPSFASLFGRTATAPAATLSRPPSKAVSRAPTPTPVQEDEPSTAQVEHSTGDTDAAPVESLTAVLAAEPPSTDAPGSGWNDGFDDWAPEAEAETPGAADDDHTIAAAAATPADPASPTPAAAHADEVASAAADVDDLTPVASADIDIDLDLPVEDAAQQEQDATTTEAETEATAAADAAAAEAAAQAQAAADAAAEAAAEAEEAAQAKAAEVAAAEAKAERRRAKQRKREELEKQAESERQAAAAAAAAAAEVEAEVPREKAAQEAARAQQEAAEAEQRAAAERLAKASPVATPTPSPVASTISHPLTVEISPANSKSSTASASHSPSSSATPASTGATPRVTPVAATPSSANADGALQAALDRARQAEEASSKLTRLLKIRELQLEKQSLESSRSQDAITKAEERLAAVHGAAERDRERLEKKYNELQRTVAQLQSDKEAQRSRNDSSEADRLLLASKDQQIAAVMGEGAVLQQKQQKLELIIKALRKEATVRDESLKKVEGDRNAGEKTMADFTTKYSALKDKYNLARDDLQDANLRLMALEQKNNEAESLAHASTNTINDLRYSLQHAQDAAREKENDLLKLQHELQAQHRTKASSSEELEALKKSEQVATERESNLLRNVQELQAELERERAAAATREDSFAAELSLASQKLSASEARNEELISAVPAATRPLLRQIESYASALHSSKEAWAALEASLQKRAHELDISLIKAKADRDRSESAREELALEHEELIARSRTTSEKLLALEATHRTLKSAHAALEEQAREAASQTEDRLHQMLSLQAERDELKSRLRSLADSGASGEKKMEALYVNEKLLRERLEAQLEHAKSVSVSAPPISIDDATGGSATASASPVDSWVGSSGSGSPHGLQFGSDKLAVTSTVEMLRSLLQQKEGEIKSLKEQNRQVEAGRASLSDELVLLTSQLNSASLGLGRLSALESSLAAMTRRHDAACLVIGEKEMELEDLREDAQQARQTYQQQIATLGEHIEQLKARK